MDAFIVYGGLFAAAFAAATILPAQSEAALAGLLATGSFSPVMLVFVASIGNILGSAVNWVLGRGIERFRHRPWFPVRPAALDRATDWYRRYGRWSLLLSWLPIIGDPLTVVAGVLREPLWSFVAIVAVAKVTRYRCRRSRPEPDVNRIGRHTSGQLRSLFGCTATNWQEPALTNQANNCPKGTMRYLGRISIVGNMPLRAMLAVVFLIMSALQPGLFANANATGLHDDAGLSFRVENPVHDASDHRHGHVDETSVHDEGQKGSHHGSKTSADKGCEVHCAPAHAVPVACPDIAPVVSRCFPPAVATILPLGEYAALIRPPRHLN